MYIYRLTRAATERKQRSLYSLSHTIHGFHSKQHQRVNTVVFIGLLEVPTRRALYFQTLVQRHPVPHALFLLLFVNCDNA